MPASGRFLLDTNIIIALMEGEEAVLTNLDRADEVFISPIAANYFSEPRNPADLRKTPPRWGDSPPVDLFSRAIWRWPVSMDG